MIGLAGQTLTDLIPVLGRARQILVGLDYDGTLTSIVDDPAAADLPKKPRRLLQQLAKLPGVYLAIISGRSLDDLRDRIDINGLIYAGNHGLDISGPGLRFVEPFAAHHLDDLDHVAEELRLHLKDIAGVQIEFKALTVSVHYRRAAANMEFQIGQVVAAVMANRTDFRLTLGKMVYEVRPKVDWHKGRALEWIRNHTVEADAPVIYAGDDETDEDVFHNCPNVISIRVGKSEDTSAQHQVDSPAEIFSLLEQLACYLKERK